MNTNISILITVAKFVSTNYFWNMKLISLLEFSEALPA